MKPSERLLDRLRDHDVEIPPGTVIVRTRAGHLQRSCGAWSWYAVDPEGGEVIGSQYSVGVLLKADELRISAAYQTPGVLEVDPCSCNAW